MAQKKSESKPMLRVTMVRGGAHRKPAQRQALIGLGLTHRGRTRELEDTPAVRGLIRKVEHIVQVEPAQ
jgi:large subunit ribosomal protein L30